MYESITQKSKLFSSNYMDNIFLVRPAIILEIVLYKMLQRDMHRKSPNLERLEGLGKSARKVDLIAPDITPEVLDSSAMSRM